MRCALCSGSDVSNLGTLVRPDGSTMPLCLFCLEDIPPVIGTRWVHFLASF
jgi:hypothetical protein